MRIDSYEDAARALRQLAYWMEKRREAGRPGCIGGSECVCHLCMAETHTIDAWCEMTEAKPETEPEAILRDLESEWVLTGK